MKPKDKEQVMQDFKENKISILISTTVIEVGVECTKCKHNGNRKC